MSLDLDAAQTLRDLLTNPQMRDTATFKDLTLGELRAAFLDRLAATSDPAPLDAAWSALHWLATEYFIPDASGRYGLPITVVGCSCDELDKSCPHVTEAENRAFEVERTLALAAKLRDTTGREPSAS
jgi:hypothetical protein